MILYALKIRKWEEGEGWRREKIQRIGAVLGKGETSSGMVAVKDFESS